MKTPQERFGLALAEIRSFFDNQKLPYASVILQEQLFRLQTLERMTLKMKAALVDILGDSQNVSEEGVYTLVSRIHKGDVNVDCVCGNCRSLQPPKNKVCLFCGVELFSNAGALAYLSVDKDLKTVYVGRKSSNDTTPQLMEPKEWKNLPVIKAPQKHLRDRKSPLKSKVNEFRSWLRRKSICERFPFARDDLEAIKQQDIQAITAAVASLIPTLTREERAALNTANIGFLRNWIFENQPQSPVELKHDKASGFGYKELDFIRAEKRKGKVRGNKL